jgi:hypothetical protein
LAIAASMLKNTPLFCFMLVPDYYLYSNGLILIERKASDLDKVFWL